jgi:putative FmdB family regulatory protein
MPIYEYRCETCGHTLEALQKLSDAPLKDCEVCGAAALRRLISAPAFRLKGGGWYETDFKSDKEKKRNLAEGASSDAKSAKKEGSAGDKSAKDSSAPASTPKKPSPSPEAA